MRKFLRSLFRRRAPRARAAPRVPDLFDPVAELQGIEHRIIVADSKRPLGSEFGRSRSIGRIGGLVRTSDEVSPRELEEAHDRLRRALGVNACLLPIQADPLSRESDDLTAEWDCCSIDGDPIEDVSHWRQIVRSGALGRVVGAWCIAWREGDKLLMARDAIGERSLVYFRCRGILGFASTLSALLASRLAPVDIDLASVPAYLSYAYLPGRATLVAGIQKVLPGEIVTLSSQGESRRTYWELPPGPTEPPLEESEAAVSVRRALEAAVSRRLPPSGATVSATLSGGVDSSLVVALLRRLHVGPVLTFSVGFGNELPNELRWSSLVARHVGTSHRVIEITPEAVLAHLDASVGFLSDPIGDPLTVPNALLFREASAESGVVFNGEGGDPLFGGPKNLPMLLGELFGGNLHRSGAEHESRERSYLRAHQKSFDDLGAMLTDEVAEALLVNPLERPLSAWMEDERWSSFVTRLQAMNIALKGAHHILPKVDAVSFPFGVLPRSPLFDRDLVELSLALPPEQKLRGSVEKFILKEAVRDLLPTSILDRPKSGMLVPVEHWFYGPLRKIAKERLLDSRLLNRFIRRPWLEQLFRRQRPGHRQRRGSKIWLLVSLESWLRSLGPEVDR